LRRHPQTRKARRIRPIIPKETNCMRRVLALALLATSSIVLAQGAPN
jgi:hypothetical protein